MEDEGYPLRKSSPLEDGNQVALDAVRNSGRGPKWIKASITFMATAISAALGGTAAFITGVVAGGVTAAVGVAGDAAQERTNDLFAACHQETAEAVAELRETLSQILSSIKTSEEQFVSRMNDPQYVQLIRKAFTGWSRGQSEEKREMIRRLLSRAADVSDPDYGLFNLFFDWINRYNELHFRFIRSLKEQGQATKFQIWQGMGGTRVRDDSAEADVFGCLFKDLNFGHIVRKAGGRDSAGRKIRATPVKRNSPYLKSVLDNEDPQELTAVGNLFIHYAMDELIDKLPGNNP